MNVTCSECNLVYDDLYQLTFCLHHRFEMRTLVRREDGKEKVCTSHDELLTFLEETAPLPRPFPFVRASRG
jgi:hypothetical protein